ncbi:hypothetical protein N9K07_00700 [Arenitalea sp.]|jgi:serine/threonine-protein kinase HipA|nr:hypothetical protein [Algibacter sp.]MDA9069256.1 hypothetical protein [Algibacter sp.]
MRQGKVFYKDNLAETITETDGGDYIFQYDDTYVKSHPSAFFTFTRPVKMNHIPIKDYFLFLKV